MATPSQFAQDTDQYTHTIENSSVMASAVIFIQIAAAISMNTFVPDEVKQEVKNLAAALSKVAATAALTLLVPTKGVHTVRTDQNVANAREIFEQMRAVFKLHRACINWAVVRVQPISKNPNAAFTQRYLVSVAGDVEIKDLTMFQKMLDLTTLQHYFSH
mmetsp:Transcript_38345/g.94257  ORF Transcript_38345/g.94257 Transcript_38345/m.94257 type:complete len:160 (+) Transcript_38345:497-976(+)